MFIKTHGAIKVFSGNSNPVLAEAITKQLDLSLGAIEAKKFSDGECAVNIGESVRGCDIFVIQSTSTPVNDNLMELLIIVDALKRASAGRITAVMPYFGYARQDRKARSRDPISAKLVADLLQTAGINRVLTMDLHSTQLQGFFNVPVDNLMGMPVLTKYFLKRGYKTDDLIIVSPDVGSVARTRGMAQSFDAPIAIIDKRRPKANVMEVMNIVGDVEGKVCIMIDDMIDTGGTITQGAKALVDNGAKKVVCCCSHGVLSGKAIEKLDNSVISEVVMLDTIWHDRNELSDKFKFVTVADIFAEAIERIYSDLPLSKLYD
ncbi:MAG: ribose-phosphate pyrophosphokinase [Clostridia bacterium]|nr:ribose-phosphate pyrophosphokinase [Clostridia bacterium]